MVPKSSLFRRGGTLRRDNAAAFVEIAEERKSGENDGTTLYIVVTADGVGASIIVDGAIHYGATGHTGEIHMIPVTVEGVTRTLGEVVDSAAVAAYLTESGCARSRSRTLWTRL